MPSLLQRKAMNKGKLHVRVGLVLWWQPAEVCTSISDLPSHCPSTTEPLQGPACSEKTESCPPALASCQQDACRGLTKGEARQLSLWQPCDRTGNEMREKATGKKQAISKEEQKHFRDVCYFPLFSHSPSPYMPHYYYFQLS